MSAEQHQDEDSRGVEAALSRAAKQARELARKTGTSIVVMRDGNLVHETPPSDEPHETTACTA